VVSTSVKVAEQTARLQRLRFCLLLLGKGDRIMDNLGADFRRVQELEAQRQRDPQSLKQLIQEYEQIVGQLQPDENPFYTLPSKRTWDSPITSCRQEIAVLTWNVPSFAIRRPCAFRLRKLRLSTMPRRRTIWAPLIMSC